MNLGKRGKIQERTSLKIVLPQEEAGDTHVTLTMQERPDTYVLWLFVDGHRVAEHVEPRHRNGNGAGE